MLEFKNTRRPEDRYRREDAVTFGWVERCDPGRGYGFVLAKLNRVFFFTDGGLLLEPSPAGPVVVPEAIPPLPCRGDRLALHVVSGPRGLKAVWWCLEASYRGALMAPAGPVVYRLRSRRGRVPVSRLYSPDRATYTILWQGDDLQELRFLWPARKHPTFNFDLKGLAFERLDGGAWVPAGDPR